jgi:hypothetical protein
VFANESFVAVIDGVSDKTGLQYQDLSGGRWAALRMSLGQTGRARLFPCRWVCEAPTRRRSHAPRTSLVS